MSNPDFTQLIGQIRDFEHLMIPAGKTPWVKQHTLPSHPVDVVLYLGCNILRTAHLAFEVVSLFQGLGVNFLAVAGPQFCCGIVHLRSGDVEGAAKFSQATASKLGSYGAAQVVIWCPTCQLHFGELIQGGIMPRFPMTHASAFLAERAAQFKFRRDLRTRVAVHTHVGAPQRELDAKAAIKVLQSVPGVEVVGTLSSPDLGYQCAPNLLLQLGPERFRSIRDGLVRKARELGADEVVTLYHSCHREWCESGERELSVRNYVSIVAEALGCAHRDYFQEFKRLGTPEAILALSRPMWGSHGLSEEHAKGLVTKYFVPKKG
jgi:heterodisulfide reductase subunit D